MKILIEKRWHHSLLEDHNGRLLLEVVCGTIGIHHNVS